MSSQGHPHKSEGIEPFTLVNSPPGQVEAVALHPINSLSGQVRVTPLKIRRYRALHPGQLSARSSWGCSLTPNQLSIRSSWGHPSQSRRYQVLHHGQLSTIQVRVTPCSSEGIKPFTAGQPSASQVRATSSHLINTPSGPLEVTSSFSFSSSHLCMPRVPFVLPPSMSAPVTAPTIIWIIPVTSPPCPYLLILASILAENPHRAMSSQQPVDLPIGSDHPQSAFIEEVDIRDHPCAVSGSPTLSMHWSSMSMTLLH